MWDLDNKRNLIFASIFIIIQISRLLYQNYLSKNRIKSTKAGDWGEILLVLIPKNILIIYAAFLLVTGVPYNLFFYIGWFLFIFGIITRIVALKQLDKMYSINIEIRPEHKLITHGIYSLVRHPLYFAYIIDTIGIITFLQKIYLIPVIFFIIIGWAIRIKNEEDALRSAFGSVYDEYALNVPSLNIVRGLFRKLKKNKKRNEMHQVTIDDRTEPPNELSENQKSEIEVHLAEYKSLSEFQRDAKATFVRVAMYHNTGILIAFTWIYQHFASKGSLLETFQNSEYLLPILFVLPVINAVLIVACGYQIYSFYCVAKHFQNLRNRLKTLLGNNVLGYEDKFGKSPGKELSIILDAMAASMWFMIPLLLAFTMAIGSPILVEFRTKYSLLAYLIGTFFSVIAIFYLIMIIILILRTRNRCFNCR